MVVAAANAEPRQERSGRQVVALGAAARARLVPIVAMLRSADEGPTFVDWADRKVAAHFKTADRNNARFALILGDDELENAEIVVRDLVERTERRLPLSGSAQDIAGALSEATR